jgi:hypothetical protein
MPGGLRFFERRDQIRERAVVDATTVLRRGNRQTDRQVRLAHAGGPRKTTFSRRSTKPLTVAQTEIINLALPKAWKGIVAALAPFDYEIRPERVAAGSVSRLGKRARRRPLSTRSARDLVSRMSPRLGAISADSRGRARIERPCDSLKQND